MNVIYVGLFVATVGSGAYFYYKDTQDTIQRLTSNLASYKIALETAQASLNTVKEEMERQQEANGELQVNLQKSEARLGELRSKFSEHDLTKLAIAKPGLIERRINNGTEKVFDELEALTDPTPPAPDDSVLESSSGSSD